MSAVGEGGQGTKALTVCTYAASARSTSLPLLLSKGAGGVAREPARSISEDESSVYLYGEYLPRPIFRRRLASSFIDFCVTTYVAWV